MTARASEAPTVRRTTIIGRGRDGVLLRTRDADGVPVLVVHLVPDALGAPEAMRRLKRRLDLHKRLENEPGALRVRSVKLEARNIVVEAASSSFRDGVWPSQMGEIARRVLPLLRALAAAHKADVVHGAIDADTVRVREDGSLAIALLGLQVFGDAAPSRDKEDDVRAVGELIRGARAEGHAPDPLSIIADAMCEERAEQRPSMHDVALAVRRICSEEEGARVAAAPRPEDVEETQADDERGAERIALTDGAQVFGRFHTTGVLGAGGMGQVFRAVDDDTGKEVALKVLRAVLPSKKALERFHREARLLQRMAHPGIARFIGSGEKDGAPWLAVELVRGRSLSDVLKERGPLRENETIEIACDLLRALVDVHDNGVVHRDVKPQNVMLLDDAEAKRCGTRIKLIDFGVARDFDGEPADAAGHGGLVGTPLYMAPEQCLAGGVDARTDVYAVGTLLWQMIVGHAPFADGRGDVLGRQVKEPPRALRAIMPGVSEALSAIVARCLEKSPEKRFANARAALAAIEEVFVSTTLPADGEPAKNARRTYHFDWRFSGTPEKLWPFVTNTHRINRAAGYQPPEKTEVRNIDGVPVRFVSGNLGVSIAWREEEFDWEWPRHASALRHFERGPMGELKQTISLVAEGRDTKVSLDVDVELRGMLAPVLIPAAARLIAGAYGKAYKRIEEIRRARERDERSVDDPWEAVRPLPRSAEQALVKAEESAVAAGADVLTVGRIGGWLRATSPSALARIRPLEVAAALGLDGDLAFDALLHLAAHGALVPVWSLLCPGCRETTAFVDALRMVRGHVRCDLCDLAVEPDLARTVELAFRTKPSIRECDPVRYCVASPAHSPHVLVQARLAPWERRTLSLRLPVGAYEIGPRAPYWRTAFSVADNAIARRFEVGVVGWQPEPGAVLPPQQEIVLHNDTAHARAVRIERARDGGSIVTGARALVHPLFRTLFPGELVAERERLAASDLSVLAVGFPRGASGEGRVHAAIVAGGGSVLREDGAGLVAAFADPRHAARAASQLVSSESAASIRAALHRGPVTAAGRDVDVDWLGEAIDEVQRLVERCSTGDLRVSEALLRDRSVADALAAAGVELDDEVTLDDAGTVYALQNRASAASAA